MARNVRIAHQTLKALVIARNCVATKGERLIIPGGHVRCLRTPPTPAYVADGSTGVAPGPTTRASFPPILGLTDEEGEQ